MIKVLRRSLRGWKNELSAFWGRFNTFYRIVLGVVLAICIICGARSMVLDPQQEKLNDLREKLAGDAVPETVSTPDIDEDVQQALMKAENIRSSIEKRKAKLEELEQNTEFKIDATVSTAAETVVEIATDCDLKVQESRDFVDVAYEDDAKKLNKKVKKSGNEDTADLSSSGRDSLIPFKAKQFELRGDFLGIREFLKKVERAPLLWNINNVSVKLLTDQNGLPVMLSGGKPVLSLRFRMVLQLYGRGD